MEFLIDDDLHIVLVPLKSHLLRLELLLAIVINIERDLLHEGCWCLHDDRFLLGDIHN